MGPLARRTRPGALPPQMVMAHRTCSRPCTASSGRADNPGRAAAGPRRGRRVVAAAGANGARTKGLTDPAIPLVNGAVVDGPDLSVEVNGLKLPNPFVIGSGPPGTNYAVMKKAFDEGWGGVICKTLSLDSSKVGARRKRALIASGWLRAGRLKGCLCMRASRACVDACSACMHSVALDAHMLRAAATLHATLARARRCRQVINVTPRYAKLLDSNREVFGWENFELISGEPRRGARAERCSRSMRMPPHAVAPGANARHLRRPRCAAPSVVCARCRRCASQTGRLRRCWLS